MLPVVETTYRASLYLWEGSQQLDWAIRGWTSASPLADGKWCVL